ncbi:hypothetical protein [Pseudomonas sp.]|uniref:hypothetical protein n=1 Tax=Pseudomonas sp. TaxID=306 RepID=UPI002909638F|nr:hypothetical protein [Pseudomonas sp.]MDU4254431.1 hypothetical protein [Pseudomonas sp.]
MLKQIFVSALFVLSQQTLADSTVNGTPAVSQLYGSKGAGCSVPFDQALTYEGESIFCIGGTWQAGSLSGYERVADMYIRTAADNDHTIVRIAYCPVGKRVIQSLCNFNGGTNQHDKPLGHTDGDRGAWCFYRLYNAYDPAFPGGIENSLVTTAICINAQ